MKHNSESSAQSVKTLFIAYYVSTKLKHYLFIFIFLIYFFIKCMQSKTMTLTSNLVKHL